MQQKLIFPLCNTKDTFALESPQSRKIADWKTWKVSILINLKESLNYKGKVRIFIFMSAEGGVKRNTLVDRDNVCGQPKYN